MFVTLLLWLHLIAFSKAEEKCSCLSRSLSNEGHISCQVTNDCENASQAALISFNMDNFKLEMKPRKQGLVITWTTRFTEDAVSHMAWFMFKRVSSTRNLCNLVILNVSTEETKATKINASVTLDCSYSNLTSGMSYRLWLAPVNATTSALSLENPGTFSGQALLPADYQDFPDAWLASAFVRQYRENCSTNSRLLLSFALPHFEYQSAYRVMLCLDSNCGHPVSDVVTQTNEAVFYNVTPGSYVLWISPNDDEHGNSANDDSFVVLEWPKPTWNTALNTTIMCQSITKLCCFEVNYQPPAPALQYNGYTIKVRSSTNLLKTHRVTDTGVNHAKLCGLTPGFYDIEVTPHGTCPQWIESRQLRLSINLLEPDNGVASTSHL